MPMWERLRPRQRQGRDAMSAYGRGPMAVQRLWGCERS